MPFAEDCVSKNYVSQNLAKPGSALRSRPGIILALQLTISACLITILTITRIPSAHKSQQGSLPFSFGRNSPVTSSLDTKISKISTVSTIHPPCVVARSRYYEKRALTRYSCSDSGSRHTIGLTLKSPLMRTAHRTDRHS